MASFELFTATHRLLTLSLRLRSQRHELLTANLANADTPGYRPRDIDFASALRAFVDRGAPPGGSGSPGGGIELISTHPLVQMPAAGLESPAPWVKVEERLDENGVDLDREVSELMENSLAYEAGLTLLGRLMARLRYAISEGRR